MFVNKSQVCISQSKQCYNAKLSALYLKTKILVDFHNCISVPLSSSYDAKFFKNWKMTYILDRNIHLLKQK